MPALFFCLFPLHPSLNRARASCRCTFIMSCAARGATTTDVFTFHGVLSELQRPQRRSDEHEMMCVRII